MPFGGLVRPIAEHFDITQQAVSQRLKVLGETGLVEVRAERQRRLYLVRPEGLRTLETLLAQLRPTSLLRLKRAVEGGEN